MTKHLLALAALSLAAPAQRDAASDDPLDRFRALDRVDRSTIVRGVVRRLSLDPDPIVQRIVSMQRGFESWPIGKSREWHEAARWAKGVAPERKLVRPGTDAHAAVRRAIPRVPFLPELRRATDYDWSAGKVVRRREPLNDEEVFANLLAGFPPGSDQTVAQILAALDKKRSHAKVAAYAGHLYADLQANVYEGVTIYEAWYAEAIVDVPDVDAIPFAKLILKTNAYESPIPKGPKRAALYGKIRDAVFSYRKYRTLREAAAAAFVTADPALDPTYRPLIPRFHTLYADSDEDPQTVARRLAGFPDREAFLKWADENVEQSREVYEKREQRRKSLERMAMKVRRMALAALER